MHYKLFTLIIVIFLTSCSSERNEDKLQEYKEVGHLTKNLDELDIFIKDVISVSNSKSVICSVKSGAGLIIMLLSKGNFYTPEKFLNIENIYFSFSDILYKYYLKHNTLKNLLKHNKDYFLSRPIQKFNNLRNKFKKSL